MTETTYQKIIRKSGFKPINCKCDVCKTQCRLPCLGTPEDMQAIKDAGFSDRLEQTTEFGPLITRPKYDEVKRSCTFFTNGLCELHDAGLKPTVGKLSHHSTKSTGHNLSKLPSAGSVSV